MIDQYNREIDYMRISITDRCNFRCQYCMPEEGVEYISHREILTYEEILRTVRIVSGLGIFKIKITGGEPLVRKGVCSLIRDIRKVPGIESVTITTNGSLLPEYLPELQSAGISGINISLDTLDKERFCQITRRDQFEEVLRGIHMAVDTGIPVKINCVPVDGFNADEIAKIAGLAKEMPLCVRFIELMPIGVGDSDHGIRQEQVQREIENYWGEMVPVQDVQGNGPAAYYRIQGFAGRIGFISAISHEFCGNCNRIRLTSEGVLKPCLNYESHLNLRDAMRSGMKDLELEALIRNAIYHKPSRHGFEERNAEDVYEHRKMAEIGG